MYIIGDSIDKKEAETNCDPIVYNRDLDLKNYVSYDNKPLSNNI